MGEGQFRVDDSLQKRLDELDDQAMAALEASNEVELDQKLEQMFALVRAEGERLADDDLSASDVIIPPADLTLEETRELVSHEGLIPDLP
jgi:hypothetical protein